MATQVGWIFLLVILVLMGLFAVSVVVSARKQRDLKLLTEEDRE
ncbi:MULTISPECIES: hypothetical protein [Sporosarcina]|nr:MULTISPECIES: hypothetical protein [Sporosarcina]